jgi:5-formyltetrahydrofolate cyclo-ligase
LSIDKLRHLVQARRELITTAAQKVAAQQLAVRIASSPIYQHSHHVAVYCAVGGEISVEPLIERAWQAGKQCYLPVVRHQSLIFVPYDQNTLMHKNRFGIPEPVNCENAFAAVELDLVLTPLVAFDHECHRIGMGGGYYDRTFAFLQVQKNTHEMKQKKEMGDVLLAAVSQEAIQKEPLQKENPQKKLKEMPKPFLMGVAHSCQQVDMIKPEAWDVSLNSIYTDLKKIAVGQFS